MPQYDTFFSLSSPAVIWNPRCAASAVSLCLRTLPHAFFSSRFFSLWLDANTSVSRLLLSTYMLSLEKGRGGTQGRRNEGPALTPKLPSGGEIRKKCNRRKTIKTYTQNGCMVLWKSMGFEIKQPLIYHFWMVGMFANVYILSSLEDIVSLLLEKEERIEEVGGRGETSMWGRNIGCLLVCTSTGDQTRNLTTCLTRNWTCGLSVYRTMLQSSEPHGTLSLSFLFCTMRIITSTSLECCNTTRR